MRKTRIKLYPSFRWDDDKSEGCDAFPPPASRLPPPASRLPPLPESLTMTTNDTLFGKIIRREIPATIVHDDEDVLGFKDIAPQAPVHVLFIPKNVLIPTLDDLQPDQAGLVGKMVLAATAYARAQGLAEEGYRLVINCREHAGQTVFHLHLHLLAGAPLGHFGTP